jgi:hypothetical protein
MAPVPGFMLNASVFVSTPTDRGFYGSGSCFIVEIEEEQERFYYAVTCRHLIRDGLCFRIRQIEGPPKVIRTSAADWIAPADEHIDLAVCPINIRDWGNGDDWPCMVSTVRVPDSALMSAKKHQIPIAMPVGSELAIPALFTGAVGELTNTPIMRIATLASHPQEPLRDASPRHPAYLIETKSLGGTSGSPVFFNTAPSPTALAGMIEINQQSGLLKLPYVLIGMLLGAYSGTYNDDFIPVDQRVIPSDANFNSGISVVLPAEPIVSFLLTDERFVAGRKEALADVRTGYRHLYAF